MKISYLFRGLVCSLAVVIAFCLALGLSFSDIGRAAPVSVHKSVQTVDPGKFIGAIPDWSAAEKIFPSQGSSKISIHLSCLTNTTATLTTPRCYSPQQFYNAYDVNGLLNSGNRGKGQTIVIIDASSSPSLQSDLHTYDQLFGLKDPRLNVIAPFGMPPTNNAFYVETALDVEMAHSMAPDATIDLVLTGDTSKVQTVQSFFYDLLKAVKYAVDNNLGGSISISYGDGESCVDNAFVQYEHSIFQEARDKAISVFVSSGDQGAAVGSCTSGFFLDKGVSFLSADPLVTSVGGTTLDATVGSGSYVSETTWDNTTSLLGASGGGFSTLFPRPDYQDGVAGIGTMRGLPDVSWDGDPLTGVPIVISSDGGFEVIPIGGTSAGAPAWGAFTALFNQYAGQRLGFLNEAFYRILKSNAYNKGFYDITTGNNNFEGITSKGKSFPVTGYHAGPGWDAATGLGTPKVNALAPLLKQYVHEGDGQGL